VCPDYRGALFYAPGYPEDQEYQAPTNCKTVWFATLGFAVAGFISFTFLTVFFCRRMVKRVMDNRRIARYHNIVRSDNEEDEAAREEITGRMRLFGHGRRNYGALVNQPTSNFDIVAALSGAETNPSAPPPPPRCPTAPTTTTEAEVYSLDNSGFTNV